MLIHSMRTRESFLLDTILIQHHCKSFPSHLNVQAPGRPRKTPTKKGFFGGLLGGFGKSGNAFKANGGGKRIATSADILRNRQGAIKVEPKVFFANERTFLAWLHCAVLLAGASIAIMSFAETDMAGQLYGVILLPVSIAFMTYAMSQCELNSCCYLLEFGFERISHNIPPGSICVIDASLYVCVLLRCLDFAQTHVDHP